MERRKQIRVHLFTAFAVKQKLGHNDAVSGDFLNRPIYVFALLFGYRIRGGKTGPEETIPKVTYA